MASISEISGISGLGSINNLTNLQNNATKPTNDNSFEDILKNAVSKVNESQVEGYNAMSNIATGNVTNLQEAVQKIEEAELTLKLALEVKNKALGAYKEIMRMQV